MKKVLLFTLMFFALNSYAKDVKIRTIDIKHFLTVNNSKFYVVMKNGKKYQLHNLGQLKAVEYICFKRERITINVK